MFSLQITLRNKRDLNCEVVRRCVLQKARQKSPLFTISLAKLQENNLIYNEAVKEYEAKRTSHNPSFFSLDVFCVYKLR